ncbi:MAG: hypothetical protein Q9217_005442 [Psora testacea]
MPYALNEPPSTDSTTQLSQLLDGLNGKVEEVLQQLDSPKFTTLLEEKLHDPDHLPDRQLEAMSSQVVDSMDKLQLRLVPSVMLLADGFFGYLFSKALWTVVDARVPDVIAEKGPLTTAELGLRVGIQPKRLNQLLDTLINNGIFLHDSNTDRYSNNRTSRLLCRDHWTQWHLWADLYPNNFFDISRSMQQAVKIGEARSAYQIEHETEKNMFDHLSEQGIIGKFHNTLGAGAIAQAGGLSVDYPWGEIGSEHFVDIGGGSGAFLASILREHPKLTGSLLDLQHVVDAIKPEFREPTGKFSDVGAQVRGLLVGDFLKQVPPASVYTMKWCLHDWTDVDVVNILKNVRRSILPSAVARLIIFESVKQEGRSGRLPRYGDLIMMITVNGEERSQTDWERLAYSSGWRVEQIMPLSLLDNLENPITWDNWSTLNEMDNTTPEMSCSEFRQLCQSIDQESSMAQMPSETFNQPTPSLQFSVPPTNIKHAMKEVIVIIENICNESICSCQCLVVMHQVTELLSTVLEDLLTGHTYPDLTNDSDNQTADLEHSYDLIRIELGRGLTVLTSIEQASKTSKTSGMPNAQGLFEITLMKYKDRFRGLLAGLQAAESSRVRST